MPRDDKMSRTTPAKTVFDLRIVSWNIGLRGLERLCSSVRGDQIGAADTHGIQRKQAYGSLESLLAVLDADIVCLQEVKLRELGAPERRLALIAGWESYFSLCARDRATRGGRLSR